MTMSMSEARAIADNLEGVADAERSFYRAGARAGADARARGWPLTDAPDPERNPATNRAYALGWTAGWHWRTPPRR
jgi:hypothetical protein